MAATLASRDGDFARTVAAELHGPRFRLYANEDLVGAEVGGAVKNVMAIAAGISDGLLRIAVGLEAVEDLQADLERGLALI